MNAKCAPGAAEDIELDSLPARNSYMRVKSENILGHLFCLVPLVGYTFCDHCNTPIWKADGRPFCMKCVDCHITCHCPCIHDVQVHCEKNKDISFSPVLSQTESSVPPSVISTNKNQCFTESPKTIAENDLDNNPLGGQVDLYDDYFFTVRDLPTKLSLRKSNSKHCDTHNPFARQVVEDYFVHAPIPNEDEKLSHTIRPTLCGSINSFTQGNNTGSRCQIKRSATSANKLKSSNVSRLNRRCSFFIGNDSNANIYSRLSYDFSSLDTEVIEKEGIRVRDLNPSSVGEQLNKSAFTADNALIPSHLPVVKAQHCCNPNLLDENQSVNDSRIESTDSQHVDKGLACAARTTHQSQATMDLVNSVDYIPMTVGPRNCLPWTPKQLVSLIEIYNDNEFGLKAKSCIDPESTDCEGRIRIHINLLRPVKMVLKRRPVSIFDIIGSQDPDDECVDEEGEGQFGEMQTCNQHFQNRYIPNSGPRGIPKSAITADTPYFVANKRPSGFAIDAFPQMNGNSRSPVKLGNVITFHLPRGSTKLLHIRLSTTVETVICTLLERFGIVDNPKKFALYEHTIEGDKEVSVRKLFDNESPLGLLFKWVEQKREQFPMILNVKRLVLQENQTDDIEWSTFGLPELHIFLGILNREEDDYRKQIEVKYDRRRNEIERFMKLKKRKLMKSNKASYASTASEQSKMKCTEAKCASQSNRLVQVDAVVDKEDVTVPSSPNKITHTETQIIEVPVSQTCDELPKAPSSSKHSSLESSISQDPMKQLNRSASLSSPNITNLSKTVTHDSDIVSIMCNVNNKSDNNNNVNVNAIKNDPSQPNKPNGNSRDDQNVLLRNRLFTFLKSLKPKRFEQKLPKPEKTDTKTIKK